MAEMTKEALEKLAANQEKVFNEIYVPIFEAACVEFAKKANLDLTGCTIGDALELAAGIKMAEANDLIPAPSDNSLVKSAKDGLYAFLEQNETRPTEVSDELAQAIQGLSTISS